MVKIFVKTVDMDLDEADSCMFCGDLLGDGKLTEISVPSSIFDPDLIVCQMCLVTLQKAIHKHLAAKLFNVEEI